MSRSFRDRIVAIGLGVIAIGCSGSVLLILLWTASESLPALKAVGLGQFLTDERWLPGSEREPQYGALPILFGSVLVTAAAIIPATIIGLGAAIYGEYYSPKFLKTILHRSLELLAGIPSVVVGFWALIVLVPLIAQWAPPGQGLFAATIVLALMILPTVALTSASSLAQVPSETRAAAKALGLGRATQIIKVYLPSSRAGILGGVLLAAARAVGETLAVVMVCGNIAQFPTSFFDPIRPVTAAIALEMGYATSFHRSALFVLAFILVLAVIGLLGASKLGTGIRRR
ncbi:MAG: phosphate ABC transporter permease subunit PstC [Verrucomicrobiota bacterium]